MYFLANVSSPKLFDVQLQTLQVHRTHDVEGAVHILCDHHAKVKYMYYIFL